MIYEMAEFYFGFPHPGLMASAKIVPSRKRHGADRLSQWEIVTAGTLCFRQSKANHI